MAASQMLESLTLTEKKLVQQVHFTYKLASTLYREY